MYNPEELAQIILDQNRLDARSLTTIVDKVTAEEWGEITGWEFDKSEVAGRYSVKPEKLGATLLNFYAELVEAQVGAELYESYYKEDALRIKAALRKLESVDIAIIAGRDARAGATRQMVIERSSVALIDYLSKLT